MEEFLRSLFNQQLEEEDPWKELIPLMSPSTNYFAQDWLRNLPSTKMAQLEGWSPMDKYPLSSEERRWPMDINYNIPLAYLSGGPNRERIQWGDEGPAGARWHGASTTPAGQWLKAPWHTTHWAQDIQPLLEQFRKAGLKVPPNL